MYIHVRLLTGCSQLLTYAIPDACTAPIGRGTVVRVPLRNQVVPAVVIAHGPVMQTTHYTIREIIGIEVFPDDPYYYDYLTTLGAYYHIDPLHFIKR